MNSSVMKKVAPGVIVTAAGALVLFYKDPVLAGGVITLLGGIFWIGYVILNDILDRLGMSINDFYF